MKYFLLALLFATLNVNAQKPQEGVEVQKSRLLLLPASTIERSAGQPSHESRIREIEASLPRVLPLYRKANS